MIVFVLHKRLILLKLVLNSRVKNDEGQYSYWLESIKRIEIIIFFAARHGFGNIAGDNVFPHMLQKLYRHTSLSTTINYQENFIPKNTDEALDVIMNF